MEFWGSTDGDDTRGELPCRGASVLLVLDHVSKFRVDPHLKASDIQ